MSVEALDRLETHLRISGRTDEADEVAAQIAGMRYKQQRGAAPDMTPEDFAKLGTVGTPPPPPPEAPFQSKQKAGKLPPLDEEAARKAGFGPPSAQPDAQAQRRARRQLDGMVAANGSMSVWRRRKVVVPALRRLGYSAADADFIAVNAPLNKELYDRDAIKKALQFGHSLTPGQIGKLDPNTIQGAMTPHPIAMPAPAARAYRAALRQDQPVRGSLSRARRGAQSLSDRFMRWWGPKAQAMGDKPVPTGLGGLFLANLLFLAAVVPANAQGYPRLQLLYGTLLNRTDWTNKPAVPEKQMVPNSPIVEGIAGAATALEEGATAVTGMATAVADVAGALGSDLGNFSRWAGVAANPAGALTNAIAGAISGMPGWANTSSSQPPAGTNGNGPPTPNGPPVSPGALPPRQPPSV